MPSFNFGPEAIKKARPTRRAFLHKQAGVLEDKICRIQRADVYAYQLNHMR
jgi:hypothetical protein